MDRALITAALLASTCLAGCVTAPPRQTGDICEIFHEKDGWYGDAKNAYERWGVPIHVQLAIIRHESNFKGDAKPPRGRLLWIIPWTRPSSSYGYTQAVDSTWELYKEESGNGWADRDDFADATDFVGWYVNKSYEVIGISKWDAYSNYLAYHEGQAGYKRGTYKPKKWLRDIAYKVNARADRYAKQMHGCREDLESGGWWPF